MAAISPNEATMAVADQSNNADAVATELSSQMEFDSIPLVPDGCSEDVPIDISFEDDEFDESPPLSPQPSQEPAQPDDEEQSHQPDDEEPSSPAPSEPIDEEQSQQALAPRQPVVFESAIGPEAVESNDIRECTVEVNDNTVNIGNACVVTTSTDREYLLETINTTIPSSVGSSQSSEDDSFIATILNNDSSNYRASLERFGLRAETHLKQMILASYGGGDVEFPISNGTELDAFKELIMKLVTFDIDDYDQLSEYERNIINSNFIKIDITGTHLNWDLIFASIIHHCKKTGTLNVISYTYNMLCMIITASVYSHPSNPHIAEFISNLIPDDADYLMEIKNGLTQE